MMGWHGGSDYDAGGHDKEQFSSLALALECCLVQAAIITTIIHLTHFLPPPCRSRDFLKPF